MKTMIKLFIALIGCAALTVAGRAADAKETWADNCAKCHGADGKGDTKMGKKLGITDLTDAAVQAKFTDADIIKAVRDGVKAKDGKLAMKPLTEIPAADVDALVPFVRSFKK